MERMTYKFDTEQALQMLIEKHLNKLNAEQEYNIFLHEIFYRDTPEQEVAATIMKYGLRLYRYPSLNYTMFYAGSTKDVRPQDIVNYSFGRRKMIRHTMVFAVPKKIEIEGSAVDFSTPTDSRNYGIDIKPNSLLDELQFGHLPQQFTLGYLNINEDKGCFEYTQYERHLTLLQLEEKCEFKNSILKSVHDNNAKKACSCESAGTQKKDAGTGKG